MEFLVPGTTQTFWLINHEHPDEVPEQIEAVFTEAESGCFWWYAGTGADEAMGYPCTRRGSLLFTGHTGIRTTERAALDASVDLMSEIIEEFGYAMVAMQQRMAEIDRVQQ